MVSPHFKGLTNWSLLGLGMEIGLMPNFMKNIHIFPPSIVGSFFFFFLPSKLDVQCMVMAKKEQNKILFQNLFKLMFNKYNKQCKVGERHLNSYFYKNQNSIRCVMILKVMCVLILWLVLEIETPKIQLEFGLLIIVFIN
jgi:hypothetical protein